MTPPPELLRLVERFREQEHFYKQPTYNETQVRREFIDPFFKLLGWDVDNSEGQPEAYKDVIHEARVVVDDSMKAPDYCFRAKGVRKFYVEAKKPSVNIKEDFAPAYQLKRYSWSAKLSLGVVTDFEEFAIYLTTSKPDFGESATQGRYRHYTYDQYAEKWEEIYNLFSKEAVDKGSLEEFTLSKRKGAETVDQAFLAELEGWRLDLAQNIAFLNPHINLVDLNSSVQQIIDRIIFLRICEDREIEEYGRLQEQLEKNGYSYESLAQEFLRAEAKYNSNLFAFNAKSSHPDTITLNLNIDDRIIKRIIDHLYFPFSPYEFSVLPADVLGQVYEQFLGKVIRLSAGHQADIEEKPEVRKAGGVYYTPTFIVNHIVKSTIGRLITGKNPSQIAKLKIIDPACGSGSFLLVAYEYLLDWHRDYYSAEPKKYKKFIFQIPGTSEWRLTTATKRQILLNNIYGVDLDAQAVEVTKLSLCLKMLEGETSSSLQVGMDFGHQHEQRILPDLSDNIKSGNSLINWDYFDNTDAPTSDEIRDINPFDWRHQFSTITTNGGFDAVIGNPPWISYYSRQSQILDDGRRRYYLLKYPKTFGNGNTRINTIMMFLEKATDIVKPNGYVGFVLDKQVQDVKAYVGTRRLLLQTTAIEHIILSVPFPYINLDTTVVVARKSSPAKSHGILFYKRLSEIELDTAPVAIAQRNLLESKEAVFAAKEDSPLTRQLIAQSVILGSIARVTTGMCITVEDFCGEEALDQTWHRGLFGSNVEPYVITWPSKEQLEGRAGRKPYLCFSKELVGMVNARIAETGSKTIKIIGDETRFTQPKIFVRQGPGEVRIIAALDNSPTYYANQTLHVINQQNPDYSLRFLTGYLNSSVATYLARHLGLILHGEKKRPQIRTGDLKKIPVPVLSGKTATVQEIEHLVEQMPSIHNTEGRFEYAEEKINELVYQLFDLSEDQVRTIEQSL